MKRGDSGKSLVLGVRKPLGMSSHDVVNRVRRVFSERRVGHAGTLDPQATGVMLVCVGPATRLVPYLTAQHKRYRFSVVFGTGTDTDDASGEVIKTSPIPDEVYDPFFAQSFVSRLVGTHQQMPPVYSAIKVAGKRSYREARAGNIIELQPRQIEITRSELVGIEAGEADGAPVWIIEATVSKGTYIRSIARDIGVALSCAAHVGILDRVASGGLSLGDCVSLEALEELGERAALDPIALLGMRYTFIEDECAALVRNGGRLDENRDFYQHATFDGHFEYCSCMAGAQISSEALADQEQIAVIAENKVVGIYGFDEENALLKPLCVFPVGVIRGINS